MREGGTITACAVFLVALCLAPSAGAGDEDEAPSLTLVPQLGHFGSLSCAALSADGRFVATGDWYGRAILWDVESQTLLRHFRGPPSRVSAVAISPDGRHVLTGGGDGTARLWDAASGREIAQLPFRQGGVCAVAFTHGGGFVLTGSTDGAVMLWRLSDAEVVRSYPGHEAAVTSIRLSPDGTTLATASVDGTVRLWSAARGTPVRVLRSFEGSPVSAAFWPGGKYLATGTDEGQIRLWDVGTGRVFRTLASGGTDMFFGDGLGEVIFRSGHDELLARTGDGLTAWTVTDGRLEKRVIDGECVVRGLSASGDGSVLFLWDETRVGTCRAGALCDKPEWWSWTEAAIPFRLPSVALSTSGHRLLLENTPGVTTLWDLARGRPVKRYAYEGLLAISGDGKRGLFGADASWATCVDLDTDREVSGLEVGCVGEVPTESRIHEAVLNEDGSRIATGHDGGAVRVLDVGSGAGGGPDVKARSLTGLRSTVTAMAFSPDGQYLAAGAEDGRVLLWNIEDELLVQSFGEGRGPILQVTFPPGGDRIVIVSQALEDLGVPGVGFFEPRTVTASVRCVETGRELSRPVEYRRGVTSLALSPDERTILVALEDRSVAFHRTASAAEGTLCDGLPAAAVDLVFTADSRNVFAVLADRSVRLLDVETGRSLCSLAAGDERWTWAVWDPEGRFDGPRPGEGGNWFLGWIRGREYERVRPGPLWERFHQPDLLACCLGLGGGELREVPVLAETRRPPSLETEAGPDGRLRVRLENRGGGLGRVSVRIGGEEVVDDLRGEGFDATSARAELLLDLTPWSPEGDVPLVGVELRAYDGPGGVYADHAFVVDPSVASDAPVDPTRPRLIPGHPVYDRTPVLSRGGRWGVTPDHGGPARVWDCEQGVVIRRLGTGCPNADAAAISSDGRLVAVCESDRTIKVWNWRSREVRYEQEIGGPAAVVALLESPPRLVWVEDVPVPDGAAPILTQTVQTLRIDAEGRAHGKQEERRLPVGGRCLAAEADAEGGLQLLVLSSTGRLYVIHDRTGRDQTLHQVRPEVWRHLRDAHGLINPLNAAGSLRGDLATLSLPRVAGAFSLSSDRVRISVYPERAWSEGDVHLGRVASDGRARVAYTKGAQLLVRDTRTNTTVFQVTVGPEIGGLSFDPRGQRLYVSTRGALKEIDLATGSERRFGAPSPRYPEFRDEPPVEIARRVPPRDTVTLVHHLEGIEEARPWVAWGLAEGRPVGSGVLPPRTPPAPAEPLPPASFEPEPGPEPDPGPRRVAVSPNGTWELRVWAGERGGSVFEVGVKEALWTLGEEAASSAVFDPAGDHLVSIEGGVVVLRVASDGATVRRQPLPDPRLDRIRRVTRGGRYVLLESTPLEVRVVDESAPDGRDVLLARGMAPTTLLDLETGAGWSPPSHSDEIVDLSLDGSTVLVEESHWSVVYDRETRARRCALPVVNAELTADGGAVVALQASIDGRMRELVVYETNRGRPLGRWATDP